MAHSYDRFAPYFEAWQAAFGGAYDDLVLPRILTALSRHAPPVRRGVDLGIGTGRARPRRVRGDRSSAMLEAARAKLAAAGLAAPPVLLEQDLRALALAEPADAALCVCTVMNQLTGDGDLARALATVRAALVPGGLFLFELNQREAYATYWTGVETIALPDAVVTRTHRRSGTIGEAEGR